MSPLPDYLQAVMDDVQTAKKEGVLTAESLGQSTLTHVIVLLLLFLAVILSATFGWKLPEVLPPPLPMDQQTQIEFVVVNNTRPETPRDLKTRNRAKVNSRSGGVRSTETPREAQNSSGGRPTRSQMPSSKGNGAVGSTSEAPAPKAEKDQKARKSWWSKESPSKTAPIAVKKPTGTTAPAGGSPNAKSSQGEGDDELLAPVKKPTSSSGGTGKASATRVQKNGTGTGDQNRAASAGNVKGAGGTGNLSSAAKSGGGGGPDGVDALVDIDMSPYISQVQRRISRNWIPAGELSSLTSEYTLTISRSGELLNYRIKRSSGNALFEQKAVAAIVASAPFPRLPDGYKGSSIIIDYYFDYKKK
jgi:colicin import membrane protein